MNRTISFLRPNDEVHMLNVEPSDCQWGVAALVVAVQAGNIIIPYGRLLLVEDREK